MTLSLFSVLLVPPFEGNELEPKSNLTVGMWTNSGRRVGALGLAVLLAEVERKAWGVAFAGFPLFGGSSVVVRGTGVVGWWATGLVAGVPLAEPFSSNKKPSVSFLWKWNQESFGQQTEVEMFTYQFVKCL